MKEKFQLPLFFPDATRAVVRTLDNTDIKSTSTNGILVNTYHLYRDLGIERIKKVGGIKQFMNWDGLMISDSGGFQVMSLAKKGNGKVTDEGVEFISEENKRILLTPELSIEFQIALGTDLMVVLDDFTPADATHKEAEESVERTIDWAKRSRATYEKKIKTKNLKHRPLLIGVVQGGSYADLRKYCAEELIKIGFDGFGFGGWPLKKNGEFDYEIVKLVADLAPKDYLLYGLGIGKPEDIVGCYDLGYTIFDCVIPTRDARHGRLFVYNVDSIEDIDITNPDFYKPYYPAKIANLDKSEAVSKACDCLLCTNYSKAYLAHLFRIKSISAMRLATIHNLRFYSLLMEKLGKKNGE